MSSVVNYHQGPLIPDIASHVFSFLDTQGKQNVARVCRLWRDVVYLPVHWKNVTVELPPTCSELLIQSFVKRRITRDQYSRYVTLDTYLIEEMAWKLIRIKI